VLWWTYIYRNDGLIQLTPNDEAKFALSWRMWTTTAAYVACCYRDKSLLDSL